MYKFARLVIGSGESCPDIRYAAGFSTPDEFIYFDTGLRRGVLVSPLEFGRARKSARPGVEVLPESEFGSDRVGMLAGIL